MAAFLIGGMALGVAIAGYRDAKSTSAPVTTA